jgi:hypothetical protein
MSSSLWVARKNKLWRIQGSMVRWWQIGLNGLFKLRTVEGKFLRLCTQSRWIPYLSTCGICNYVPVMESVNDKRLNCKDLPSLGI